jgi:hypothetical protein
MPSRRDMLTGPVAAAARKALDTGNMDHLFPWASRKDEGEFNRALRKELAAKPLDVSDVPAAGTFAHARLCFVLWLHGLYSYATASGHGKDRAAERRH